MIEFTSGDMFGRAFDARVNTVNCVGVMGAGVALAFKERYPEMFREYKRECEAGRIKPGKLHVWKRLHGDWVINFPTKRHWRDKSRYEDIKAGLEALREYLKDYVGVSVALPALGCGHGGLDWGRVSAMIQTYLSDTPAIVSVFEPKDSRAIGAKVPEADQQIDPDELERADVGALDPDNPLYPDGLRETHARRVFYHGPSELLRFATVALVSSFKPAEREAVVVRALAEALAHQTSVVLAFILTGNRTREVIESAIAQGTKVVAWVPRGLMSERLPKWVEHLVQAKLLVAVSVAPPKARWAPGTAREAFDAAAAASAAVIIADPKPDWLKRADWRSLHERHQSLFFVRYQDAPASAQQLWHEVKARPIGRDPSTGIPNVRAIVTLLATAWGGSSASPQHHPIDATEPVRTGGAHSTVPVGVHEARRQSAAEP